VHAGTGSGVGPSDLDALQARLGRTFSDAGLLAQALAHRSWCSEAGGQPSNERLEFLGDAVLGLAVAEHCYRHYPELAEGSLAKVRAAVVNTGVLAEVGLELGLGEVVLLGRGESASGGRRKPSIVANTTEAVIGAVYLDGGWESASSLVLRLLGARISDAAAGPGSEDFKTRLQEVVARRVHQLPRYEVVGTGPDHERRYRARVFVQGAEVGEGRGRSKKDAEQAAARMAWLTFARFVVVEDATDGSEPADAGRALPDAHTVSAGTDTATGVARAVTGGEQEDA
jgi:ribonuclease III